MFPTLLPGDEIVSLENSSVTIGDIISYQIENKNILHRVTKIEDKKIYTKGDNNLKKDHYSITKVDIIGKLTQVRRKNKIHTIRNGFAGYLTGKKCLLIKRLTLFSYVFIKPICNLKPVLWVSNKIGQVVFNNHLSIIKKTNNSSVIYYGKIYLGYYDFNKKEWMLRNRFKPFFSQNQLQKIIEHIDTKRL
ncbi:MAG: S24/S26 family peptidase [Desulfobacteraceae bacterium]|nr:S24/S26 family peptidase [Desulfobacteraceae bacterium]